MPILFYGREDFSDFALFCAHLRVFTSDRV